MPLLTTRRLKQFTGCFRLNNTKKYLIAFYLVWFLITLLPSLIISILFFPTTPKTEAIYWSITFTCIQAVQWPLIPMVLYLLKYRPTRQLIMILSFVVFNLLTWIIGLVISIKTKLWDIIFYNDVTLLIKYQIIIAIPLIYLPWLMYKKFNRVPFTYHHNRI